MTRKDCLILASVRSHKDWILWPSVDRLLAGRSQACVSCSAHRMQKHGQSLLHCTFSNLKTTFNFIKKLMKSNLAAGHLLLCEFPLLCAGTLPSSSGALLLSWSSRRDALLIRPQPEALAEVPQGG